MDDQKETQSVIVSAYLTRTKSILWIIAVAFVLFMIVQFQFSQIDSDSHSNDWWISNLAYFMIIIMTIYNLIKARRSLKEPFEAVFHDSSSPFVTIQGQPKYAGQWTVKKNRYQSNELNAKIILLIVLLFWILAVVDVFHFLRNPRLQTAFDKHYLVQQFEMALLFTFLAIRYWSFRKYHWYTVLKQSGTTLTLYSKGKVGAGLGDEK